ncbi:MAG: hypothetical protein QOF25_4435 [Mycobacterium sp.]|jgi:hypothetical protein|nr:hypothetical protein [Mycobacterium sp.]
MGSSAYGVNQCPAKVVHRPVTWAAAGENLCATVASEFAGVSPATTTHLP